ncbi:autotransporter outer membrane beta-barrel domain-containing protein [Hafnia paralvei]|nr:autotransporter outer membrane beta-barrel domain-containing protein [Hafnia paralvei]
MMNKIYRVVWNFAVMAWTVVSELGRGKTKTSSPKKLQRPRLCCYGLASSMLLFIAGEASALDINGYTDFTSSTSITDGLQWNTTATVQVDNGADVTVSGGNPTLNMAPTGGANTSLWINGGSLTTSDNSTVLMGNNSMLQIGGAQLGGLTSEQSGGAAGVLSVGDIQTAAGATDATIWMFGSTSSTAKLNASNISLTADKNNIWLANPSNSELGADVNVTGNMTVVNTLGGTFMMVGNSQLKVGGDLYLDTTNGSFLATNNNTSQGIMVGGDLTFVNNVKLSDVNSVSTEAGIYSTVVNVEGDINVIGKNVGNTGLQIINASDTGITTHGDFNIVSSVSGNTTDVIMGHAAKVTAGEDINLNSVQGGKVNLYIGDSRYGAPTSIVAKNIVMSGAGENKVIFNNTKPTQPGTDGYLFNVSINGEGTVEQQSGHTTLGVASDYKGGTIINGGLLSIANNKALGNENVAINTDPNDNKTGLDIAYTDGSSFENKLLGNGDTTVSGNAQITGVNDTYAGNWNITGKALTDKTVSSTLSNFGSGNINVESDGYLIANSTGEFTFENKLSGTGYVVADNNGSEFTFSTATGTDFAGDVILNNNLFALEGDNSAALTHATLHIGSGNETSVGTGNQNLGGLAFDGGTLVFGDVNPGDTTSDRFIETTQDLNLTGKGQIQITDGGDFENTVQHPDTTLPLLQQDDMGGMVKLADSQGTVTGTGGNLSLIDQNGTVISQKVTSQITQNGETVANGEYDYRLTSGENNDGLYINYGLTQVELLAQGDNALTLSAEGNTGNAADLSAKIIGAGDLRIDTDTDLSLSNSDNNYTGMTDVVAGTLKMGNDNVLGQTRLLNLNSGSQFDMNGYAQTLQNLQTDAGSTLDFNQGSLTVNNGTVDGNMSGAGSLTVAGGTLTVSSDNAAMSADTTIASDGVIRMLSSQALGTGSVNNQGLLYLGQDGDSHVTRDTLTNYQTGALTNSGSVVIGHNDASGQAIAGTTLTVNGNYTGENGHLQFNTVLGDDSSVTDKLVVTGDTSGDTGVSVKNAGGVGDKTLNGIELISVGGQSDGTFTQEGRIVAGAYDYALVRGQGSNQGNWYLTSQTSPIDPVDPPIDPVDPPIDPVDPPVTPPGGGEHVNRPEGGSYIANLAAANTLFNTRLHDRLGETQYVDALTGEKKVTSLWLRQVGGHNNWRDSSGQLKTQSNSYVAQLGGDVAQWSTDGLNRGHLGLMTGYANSHNQTHSSVTGYDSKGSINGYSAGVYGTWFANDADKSGLYVDSWLQYSWFNNHVNGEQLASESYKSKGLTASLETGYTLKMGEFTGSQGTLNEWFIQPQAQATWMGVKADKHREDNGTRVNSEGDGNVQTRLGMRAYLKSHHAMDEGKVRTFEPFIEANWLHNTRSYSAKMDDVRISQAGARNIGEVKVGVEGQINPRLNLWGNVGTQVGDKGYNDSTAMIGVKYNF